LHHQTQSLQFLIIPFSNISSFISEGNSIGSHTNSIIKNVKERLRALIYFGGFPN